MAPFRSSTVARTLSGWGAYNPVDVGNQPPYRILVIEDEVKMAEALREGLEAERYSVTVARTGEEGFYLVSTQTY